MIVVSDTTPLNDLILIEAADVLPALFVRVYAPTAVMRELSDPRGPQPVRAWAGSPPEWLTVQEPSQVDETLSKPLHKGEMEAISLAQELGYLKTDAHVTSLLSSTTMLRPVEC